MIDRERLQRTVGKVIKGASALDVLILNLRFWHGLGPKIIANILGMNIDDVSKRLKQLYRKVQDETN